MLHTKQQLKDYYEVVAKVGISCVKKGTDFRRIKS